MPRNKSNKKNVQNLYGANFNTLLKATKTPKHETPLVVQWLGLHTSTAGGVGSIPGQGTKVQHAAWRGQNVKKQTNKQTKTQT